MAVPAAQPLGSGGFGARAHCFRHVLGKSGTAILAAVLVLGPLSVMTYGGLSETRNAPLYGHEPIYGSPITPTPATARLLQHRLITTALPHPGRMSGYFPGGGGWLAYVSADNSWFVAESGLFVVPANGSPPTTIPVGRDPFGVATDATTKEVFVTNSGSGNVSVVSISKLKTVGSIIVQSDPMGVAIDLTDNRLFVANNGSGTVSEIAISNLTVTSTIRVGSHPLGVVWDSTTDRIFVTDQGAGKQSLGRVSVISGSTGRRIATIHVGLMPNGLAVDNATDTVYVANQGSRNVSVINASKARVVATIPAIVGAGFYPPLELQGVAYDSQRNLIWVAGGGIYTIAINTTRNVVEDYLIADPAGVAVDPVNGDVCVTNSLNASFGCFGFSAPFTASPVFYPPAQVKFNETGLPTGTRWTITLDGPSSLNWTISWSRNSTMVFEVFPGHQPFYGFTGYSYTFAVDPVPGYSITPASGTISSSSGGNLTVSIRFS